MPIFDLRVGVNPGQSNLIVPNPSQSDQVKPVSRDRITDWYMKMRKRSQAFCPHFCVQSADKQAFMKSRLIKSLFQNEPKTGRKEEVRMQNEKSQFLAIIRVVSRNSRKTLRLCTFLSRHSFRATADALKSGVLCVSDISWLTTPHLYTKNEKTKPN
ncbi:MAG TPA: hypothetical protein VGN23_12050 [Verrucomicrobiae bacterium]|jgi:hypothetical protein